MLNLEERLYVSTACLQLKEDLEHTLTRYGELGLNNVEISGPHLYKTPQDLLNTISGFKSQGMNFLFHNYFPRPKDDFVLNLASQNKDIRLKSRTLISQALELAKKTGVDLYCCHPGYLADPTIDAKSGMFDFGQGAPLPKRECLKILLDGFMEDYVLAKTGYDGHRVFLGFETLFPRQDGSNYSLFCTKEDIEEVFETKIVQQSDLGLLIDLGHVAVSSNILGFDRNGFLDQIIEKYGDRIYEVHLSESSGSTDLHAVIGEDSWQLGVIKKFRDTGKRFSKTNTRFCIESRNLSDDEIISSYNLVKKYLGGIG